MSELKIKRHTKAVPLLLCHLWVTLSLKKSLHSKVIDDYNRRRSETPPLSLIWLKKLCYTGMYCAGAGSALFIALLHNVQHVKIIALRI